MSATSSPPHELLDRLESRHDELLERLDELNDQVEEALADILRTRVDH